MRRSWRLLGTPQSDWDAGLTLRQGRGLVERWVQAFQLPCGARKPRQGGQGVHSPAPPATGVRTREQAPRGHLQEAWPQCPCGAGSQRATAGPRVTFPPAGSRWGMYSWLRRAAARTSLAVQWTRIRPPVQGEQAQSPVEEDPTCRRATGPMRPNYRAWALQLGATATEPACCNHQNLCTLAPVLCNKRSHCDEQLFTARKSSPCSSQLEEAQAEQRRPSTAISKCTK